MIFDNDNKIPFEHQSRVYEVYLDVYDMFHGGHAVHPLIIAGLPFHINPSHFNFGRIANWIYHTGGVVI